MTPRTEPMPSQIPEWLRESVIRELDKTVGGRGWWCDSLSQRTIARLLWERGEPEPVDPDVEAVKRIIAAAHRGNIGAALAAYKAEKARP